MEDKEKVPYAVIYQKDGQICLELNLNEVRMYELLGFLKCYVNKLEEDLTNSMENME